MLFQHGLTATSRLPTYLLAVIFLTRPRPPIRRYLRALSNRLVAQRYVSDMKRILHARIPILKFKDHLTGIECDTSIGRVDGLFKSALMGLLAQFDWRFGALVRLIKYWARYHDINDASNGSLNSYAITLMVVFHLQTRTPRILPTFQEIFYDSIETDDRACRPLHNGREPDFRMLSRAKKYLLKECRPDRVGTWNNAETLFELLASFIGLWRGIMTAWGGGGQGGVDPQGIKHAKKSKKNGAKAPATAVEDVSNGPLGGETIDGLGCGDEAFAVLLSRVRVDTWHGTLRYEPWEGKDGIYAASIEDPLDATDDCARSVRGLGGVWKIQAALHAAARSFEQPSTGGGNASYAAREMIRRIFGQDEIVQELDRFMDFPTRYERHALKEALERGIPPVPLSLPESVANFLRGPLGSHDVHHANRKYDDDAEACSEDYTCPCCVESFSLLLSASTPDDIRLALESVQHRTVNLAAKLDPIRERLRLLELEREKARLERKLRQERKKAAKEARKAEGDGSRELATTPASAVKSLKRDVRQGKNYRDNDKGKDVVAPAGSPFLSRPGVEDMDVSTAPTSKSVATHIQGLMYKAKRQIRYCKLDIEKGRSHYKSARAARNKVLVLENVIASARNTPVGMKEIDGDAAMEVEKYLEKAVEVLNSIPMEVLEAFQNLNR